MTVDSLVMALRSTFHNHAARDVRAGYELRVGDIVVQAVVRDGKVSVAGGALAAPDLVIDSGPGIKAVMAGERTCASLIAATVLQSESALPASAS